MNAVNGGEPTAHSLVVQGRETGGWICGTQTTKKILHTDGGF